MMKRVREMFYEASFSVCSNFCFCYETVNVKMNIQILTLNALRFKFPGYMYVHMRFDARSCIIQGKLYSIHVFHSPSQH